LRALRHNLSGRRDIAQALTESHQWHGEIAGTIAPSKENVNIARFISAAADHILIG
jgi:hypothetical protein